MTSNVKLRFMWFSVYCPDSDKKENHQEIKSQKCYWQNVRYQKASTILANFMTQSRLVSLSTK